jgi:hypothetical protein
MLKLTTHDDIKNVLFAIMARGQLFHYLLVLFQAVLVWVLGNKTGAT